MKSLLTTATLAIGLALPAAAQVDPGRSSPLAAGMGGKQTQAQTQDCSGMWNRAFRSPSALELGVVRSQKMGPPKRPQLGEMIAAFYS